MQEDERKQNVLKCEEEFDKVPKGAKGSDKTERSEKEEVDGIETE